VCRVPRAISSLNAQEICGDAARRVSHKVSQLHKQKLTT
jgi:hypothetical protein